MRGLYAIIDADFLGAKGVPLLPFAERVVAARPAVIQLRAKSAPGREALEWLRSLRRLCDATHVPLFANDRPDLAVMARCDGVHVGQNDISVADVRRFAPALRVGVSTHDLGQLRVALEARPDYIAFGPVFPTASKLDPSPVVGLEALRDAAASCHAGGVPLVAIGGIDSARAASVCEHADMGAVISSLLPVEGLEGVTARVSALHAALAKRREETRD